MAQENLDRRSADIGALLEEVMDEMFEGFQLISSDWRYVYVNDTVAQHGRRSKEELIGHTMMECYPGIENTLLFDHLSRSMKEHINTQFENEFIYPDGTNGWFEILIRPVKSGVVILSIDISKRKHLEAELKEKIKAVEVLTSSVVDSELYVGELRTQIKGLRELSEKMRV